MTDQVCVECGTDPVGRRFHACATCRAAKAGFTLAPLGIGVCLVCHLPMSLVEPGQTTHPACDPDPYADREETAA